jgi:peptidoglycan/LPS O-acetylase OafA/YrhL
VSQSVAPAGGWSSASERRRWRAGSLSVAAGVAHGLVAPEHFREWWGYGLFFGLAAIAQVFYGGLLLIAPWRYDDTGGLRTSTARVDRTVYAAGVIGMAAVIVLYVVSRTTGIPFFGPEAGRVEPITPAGLTTKLFEAAALATLVAAVSGRRTAAR